VLHCETGKDWTEKINLEISRIVICCTLIYNFCGDGEVFLRPFRTLYEQQQLSYRIV
jgi:hypothetical protein